MESIVLAGRDALAFLLSPQMKALDKDFEFSLHVSRSANNFMSYLSGSIDYTQLQTSVDGRPRISKSDSLQLAQQLATHLPLVVMVPSEKDRRNSIRLKCLIAPTGLPGDACFQISDGLFCATPELAIIQVAKDLTDLQLIVLMSLLFSVFSKDPSSDQLIPRRSISSPEKLASFVAQCRANCTKMPDSVARVERLMPLAICKAASPMEIECAIRLGYPIDQGGCGFGIPQMNYRLNVSSAKRGRYCDLYWPEQNTAVEYQGAVEHGSLDALEADALHYNDLTSINVPFFIITAGQINDLSAFNRVARQIETQLRAYKKKRARRTPLGKFPNSAQFHATQKTLKTDLDAAFKTFGF